MARTPRRRCRWRRRTASVGCGRRRFGGRRFVFDGPRFAPLRAPVRPARGCRLRLRRAAAAAAVRPPAPPVRSRPLGGAPLRSPARRRARSSPPVECCGARSRGAGTTPVATQAPRRRPCRRRSPAPWRGRPCRRRASRPSRPSGRCRVACPPAPGRRECSPARSSWARSSSERETGRAGASAAAAARGGPVGAQRRRGSPRRRAGARAPRRVLGARLAVAVGREQRAQLGAAACRLRCARGAAKALSPLGQAAVDLGLAEAGDLADLRVGVARGEQGQGAQLGRLQRSAAPRGCGRSPRCARAARRARRRRPGSVPPGRLPARRPPGGCRRRAAARGCGGSPAPRA